MFNKLNSRNLTMAICTLIAIGFMPTTSANASSLSTIYYGGDILTMDGDEPTYAEAVVQSEGRIVFVGKKADAETKYSDAKRIDLEGKTMLPAFRDPHGHFSFAVQMVDQVNVAIPPVGNVTEIADVIDDLKAFKKKRGLKDDDWIIGWGYDQDGLKEQRHITKLDLDKDFPENPVVLIHVSRHGAVLNSKAMEWAKIDANTPTPDGGVIARLPDSNEPAGLLMETAYLPVFARMPKPSEAHRLDVIDEAQMEYAKRGYASAVDGFSFISDVEFLQKAAREKKLFIDIAALIAFPEFAVWFNNPKFPFAGEYTDNFRIAAMKITQDGSPQGKTAYMRDPYLTGGPAGQKEWRGEPMNPKEDFEALVKNALDNNLPLQVHANGDGAIDMVIEAVKKTGITAKDDRRVMIVHSQIQAPDQLDSYVELGLTPSYFTNHAFFWGDVHVMNFGKERAFRLSPMKSALDKGLVVSNHTDFNVTPLDPFFTIWTAMKRESRSGVVIGPDERVDAYAALQALTTGPAWQFFEENRVGRIKQGMLADLVILDQNPVTVTDVDRIKDITVLETIKEGETIYKH